MGDLINLSKFDKKKKWIIFFKKGCCNCFTAKKYFEAKGIEHKGYDIGTRDGIAKAAELNLLNECINGVPVIVEDIC